MGNKAAKQHFETAQKTGVLKVSQQRLNEFPVQLRTFPNVLRTLDLSENRFECLPPEVGRFTTLKHLNVAANRLTELPAAIGELVKLETLNAINNMIVQLPKEMANLRNLKQVILTNNQISQFPIMFCGLKSLDVLDLSRNKITSVPKEVKDLQAIELNLNQNQITSLAVELAECPKLKTLRLEENCLPIAEIHPQIMKDSIISNLSVDGNLFRARDFTEVEGYEIYMERFTAVKKKMF